MCGFGGNENSIIWIILLLCLCGNGSNGCGNNGWGDSSSWIWILILLCCCNHGNQIGSCSSC